MKIGLYISELLFQYEMVVLPGFGTFRKRYQPAKFMPEKKIVKPPSKIADFSPGIKGGDTLLIDRIAQKEGKSHEEVIQYLKDFVHETEHALDAGEKLTFEKLGSFYKDTAGELVFEPMQDINYLAGGTEMAAIKTPAQKPPEKDAIPPKPESEGKEKVDEKKDAIAPKLESEVKNKADESEREGERAGESESKSKSESESESESVGEMAKPVAPKSTDEKSKKEAETAATHKHKPKPPEPMTETKKKESKEVQPLPPALKWAAIIIIPLLVILIVVFLNFNFFFGEEGLLTRSDKVVVEQPDDTKPAEIPEDIYWDEPVVEEIYEPEPEIKPDPSPAFDPYVEPEQADPYRPVYYVIVGSFENKNNADVLALELRKKGHQLASVLRMTPTGFHRTYSGFYYNLNEAKAEKENLSDELREIAWILHR